jgi:hypothetical protein
VNGCALRDDHLGLRDGAIAGQIDGDSAEEVENADSAIRSLTADANEFGGWALKPGGHHVAVIVPHAAKSVPVAGVAPEDPILDYFADGEATV